MIVGSSVSNPTSPQSVPADAPMWRTRFVLSAKAHQPKMRLFCPAADDHVTSMVANCCAALDSGAVPTLVDDGLGGTYFIVDKRGVHQCVFKPRDEEPCAPNNPKRERGGGAHLHLGADGLKSGIVVGEAALNEQAAYLLDSTDRSRHFCRVPATAIVQTEHSNFYDVSSREGDTGNEANHAPFRSLKTKVGSLQQFEVHLGCADDFSSSLFSTEEVQRIALLDIRIFNLDRHGANLLVQRQAQGSLRSQRGPASSSSFGKGTSTGAKRCLEVRDDYGEWGVGDRLDMSGGDELRLVPIDHGFSLPASITVPYFEWQFWSQVRQPMSDGVREYISRIDAQADAHLLRNAVRAGSGLEVREGCVRTMRVCALLLKEGAAASATLGDIADLMCEPQPPVARAACTAVETRSPQTVMCTPPVVGAVELPPAEMEVMSDAMDVCDDDRRAAAKAACLPPVRHCETAADGFSTQRVPLRDGSVPSSLHKRDPCGEACEEVTRLQVFIAEAEAEAHAAFLALPKNYAPSQTSSAAPVFGIKPSSLFLPGGDAPQASPFESGERLWHSSLVAPSHPAHRAPPMKSASPASCAFDNLFFSSLRKRVASYFESLRHDEFAG
ncbi:hypothetical protein AB1Y20_001436 [Prymnesium parvum]|uniref:PI3K/PI4K catalytic domain-containing protein n=1 Tax=Prymnesium parvum TaxID=97485 RepID=A0AB34K884_PRYPA